MEDNALAIFIRNPVMGNVKTRIAKSSNPEKAFRIYRHLLDYTRKWASEVEAARYLYYDSFIDLADDWPGKIFTKKLQTGWNLGMRMSSAFQDLSKLHGKVVLTGSDCAEMTADICRNAFKTLDTADVVIGPASDGGYYLIGMRSYHASLFEQITWSTDKVLEETLARIRDLNLDFVSLPVLSDVDTLEDWKKIEHKFS